MMAITGCISIYHMSSSVVFSLSVLFEKRICQEYTNLGALLEKVNKPLCISTKERMGWLPVVVTGIKAPPLTQKLPFGFFATLCLGNLLDFVLPPSMTRSDKNFEVKKEVQLSLWGKEFFS